MSNNSKNPHNQWGAREPRDPQRLPGFANTSKHIASGTRYLLEELTS